MTEVNTKKEGVEIYELGYLLLPSIAEDDVLAVVKKMQDLVSSKGGVLIDSEDPFKQDLAYSMTKVVGASRYVVTDAYLGWMKFELPVEEAPAVKEAISKMNEVVRSILIKAPRETSFTFAAAKARLAEAEAKENGEVLEEIVSPEEVVVQ